jgi:hypothetical protein
MIEGIFDLATKTVGDGRDQASDGSLREIFALRMNRRPFRINSPIACH